MIQPYSNESDLATPVGYTAPPGATKTRLVIPNHWDYEDWESNVRQLQELANAWQFWAGDLLLYGERRWGEHCYQAILETTGRSAERIRGAMWVCQKVKPELRRESLSFSHHSEVASAKLDDSERILLLDKAEEMHLSVVDFRRLVKGYIVTRDDLGLELEEECLTSNNGVQPSPTLVVRPRCPSCHLTFDWPIGNDETS
jgi:hypothetical protein